jgi:hypothetical protein
VHFQSFLSQTSRNVERALKLARQRSRRVGLKLSGSSGRGPQLELGSETGLFRLYILQVKVAHSKQRRHQQRLYCSSRASITIRIISETMALLRSTPPAQGSYYPPNDAATYRDLLLFEERLKTNAASLKRRKRRYQCA